jgi:hypothetical protein
VLARGDLRLAALLVVAPVALVVLVVVVGKKLVFPRGDLRAALAAAAAAARGDFRAELVARAAWLVGMVWLDFLRASMLALASAASMAPFASSNAAIALCPLNVAQNNGVAPLRGCTMFASDLSFISIARTTCGKSKQKEAKEQKVNTLLENQQQMQHALASSAQHWHLKLGR